MQRIAHTTHRDFVSVLFYCCASLCYKGVDRFCIRPTLTTFFPSAIVRRIFFRADPPVNYIFGGGWEPPSLVGEHKKSPPTLHRRA